LSYYIVMGKCDCTAITAGGRVQKACTLSKRLSVEYAVSEGYGNPLPLPIKTPFLTKHIW